jgi:hypothetical protein
MDVEAEASAELDRHTSNAAPANTTNGDRSVICG